jgi:alkylation response protein AidB-like acyl-CoA dehydrogenase
VEGSIAKFFATEAANKAAEDAMQALGGYGYIAEFEVEKIKRDVKITCIYEGASEVQQNIISTFRWRTTVKSKGQYYNDIAAEMDGLDARAAGVGCRYYAVAARALNEAVMLVHRNKLTKKQFVMQLLADMMTHVEVGAAMGRKAAAASSDDADARKLQLISSIFACDVARLTAHHLLLILQGTDLFDPRNVSEFLDTVRYHDLFQSYQNVINDMDALADILFERGRHA